MSGPKDGAKGPAKPVAESAGGKKPSAIIDLKATEISEAKPGAAASSAAAATPAASAAATAASASRPDTTAARPAAPAAPTVDRPASSVPPAGKAESAKAPPPPAAAPAPRAPATAAAPTSRGGVGLVGVLTHLVAGVAGGLIALLGADGIGRELGLQPRSALDERVAAQMQQRIGSLESGLRQTAPAAGEAQQKLAAAERRIGELERASKELAGLQEAQAKLVAEAKALAEKVASAGGGAGGPEQAQRIARLEETLSSLSAAAGTDPQKGRIPQLAAISGKLSDLEATLAAQLAAQRKSLSQELDTRIAQTAEASEAARAGTQRIDRDLATVKADAARVGQRLEGLKSTDDRLEQSVRAMQEEVGQIRSGVEAVKGDLAQQLKSVARPQDVAGATAPLTSKLAALEQSVASVVKSETDRRQTAERIVLSLELANLKRALERGGGFAAELAEVKRIGGGQLNLAILERYQAQGVASLGELTSQLRSLAGQIIDADGAPEEASVMDRLISGARSIVRVRRTSHEAGDKSVEAIVARIETAMKDGQLAPALEHARTLSPKAQAPARAWLDRVEARHAVDKAISTIDAQLKQAIASPAAAAKGAQ
jgi:hypothetical protein